MKISKLFIFILLVVSTQNILATAKLAPQNTVEGFIARLLINEVPFPGENGYVSENDSKTAMQQILAVLANRTYNIPKNYTQRQIATVDSQNIVKVITAGGERGQIDGFYLDRNGKMKTVPRVNQRINYLISIANKGKPGRFAKLINYADEIAKNFVKSKTTDDIYKVLTHINNTEVTGCGYSWMTDLGQYHPGGTYVKIPNSKRGSLGHNRFFTLKKHK